MAACGCTFFLHGSVIAMDRILPNVEVMDAAMGVVAGVR
jgi:hypothetical protein